METIALARAIFKLKLPISIALLPAIMIEINGSIAVSIPLNIAILQQRLNRPLAFLICLKRRNHGSPKILIVDCNVCILVMLWVIIFTNIEVKQTSDQKSQGVGYG